MRTHSPIATISYCESDYLKNVLDGLVMAEDIDFYAFVFHHAEDFTLKDHIHLYIEPTHILDTTDLQFIQNEVRGTIPYKKSKFEEWFFYCSHHKEYLLDLGLTRNFTYMPSDFVSNNQCNFLARIDCLSVDHLLSQKYLYCKKVRECAKNGLPFGWLIENDYIPLNLIKNAQQLYYEYINYLSDKK